MIDDERLPLKIEFLKYYRKLPNQQLASEMIGRDEDTIIEWKKADPDFADLTKKAKSKWALKQSRAVDSPQWLLERVLKDHFSARNEVEAKGTIIVKVDSNDK